jgi:hypothetical protein
MMGQRKDHQCQSQHSQVQHHHHPQGLGLHAQLAHNPGGLHAPLGSAVIQGKELLYSGNISLLLYIFFPKRKYKYVRFWAANGKKRFCAALCLTIRFIGV